MSIEIGKIAPDFELINIDGEKTQLSRLRGKRVLLSFLRNAQCAVCNLWVHEANKRALESNRNDFEILAIFESSIEKLTPQFANKKMNFPILADENGAIHELYGSRNDSETIQRIISQGLAEAALKKATAHGFTPVMEEGANFIRIPTEVLIDEEGLIRHIHHATEVFNHLDAKVIDLFLNRAR